MKKDEFGLEIPDPPKLTSLPEVENPRALRYWAHRAEVMLHLLEDFIAPPFKPRELVIMFMIAAIAAAEAGEVTREDIQKLINFCWECEAYMAKRAEHEPEQLDLFSEHDDDEADDEPLLH